jgi:methoxymalonate biosynthesis acyl carrier protein
LQQLSTPLTDSLVDEVHALVRTFSPKVGSAQTDLLGTGILDSANLVRLLLAVEAEFAVTIPMEEVDIDSIRSIARIADLVRERRSAGAARPLAMGVLAAGGEPHGVSDPAAAPRPRAAAPGLPPERDALIREIHDLFVNSLSVEVHSPDEDLFKAGILDSMLLVQLIMLLEDQFGVSLSLEDIDVADFSTTAGIAQLVRATNTAR